MVASNPIIFYVRDVERFLLTYQRIYIPENRERYASGLLPDLRKDGKPLLNLR